MDIVVFASNIDLNVLTTHFIQATVNSAKYKRVKFIFIKQLLLHKDHTTAAVKTCDL